MFQEDLIVSLLLNKSHFKYTDAQYVDVGCNYPIECNNTYKFYLKGKRGFSIDGNKSLTEMYSKFRPGNIVYNGYAGNENAILPFFNNDNHHVSTFSLKHKSLSEKNGWGGYSKAEYVKEETLNVILENHQITAFPLLFIDVEGVVFEVLQGIDLSIHKPNLICIETHLINFIEVKESKIYLHLNKYGYRLVFWHCFNFYFKSNL